MDNVTAIDQYRAFRRQALSAAFLAKQRIASSKRATPRASVSLPITVQLDEWETDTCTTELSAGGCALMLSRQPSEGRIPVAIRLQPDLVMRGEAQVVACVPKADRFYVCLAFVDLSEEARTMLQDVVLDTLLAAGLDARPCSSNSPSTPA